MTTRILLLVSRFKTYNVAGTMHLHISFSSLYYVKQNDNESYICDLTLEQNIFDCSEVFNEKKFSVAKKNVYNLPNESYQSSYVNVSYHNELQSNFSVENASFGRGKCNHILNVDAPVFHMYLNGNNELLLEYNVYARVFTPAGLDLVCNKKYVNNAGYVVSYSPNRNLCEEKSSNTLLNMQGVSLISSHGTVHLDVAYSLDDLHTGCGSSESASTLVSIHENLHPTFLDSSNLSYTFNALINDAFSHFQHTLWEEFDILSICNHSISYDGDGLSSHISPSLVDREGCLQVSCVLALSSNEVLSNTSGHPSVLVEIPQHEEYVVKNALFQNSFKGVYGSVAFIRNKFASTSNAFSPNDVTNRRAALGSVIKDWSRCHSARGDKYCRQFGFLPLIQYQFSSYKGGGHLQTPDMVEWITKAHQSVKKYRQFNYQSSRIPVPSGLNIDNWRRYLVDYDLSILCEYLQYGFPLNVDYDNFHPITRVTNHASALRNPEAVDQYFADEVSYKASVVH